MKKVLLLGASGQIAPNIIPDMESHCDLILTDIKPYPDGRLIEHVDMRNYDQVRDAMQGMDAVMNFTVNRPDPILSFHVNVLGALHVMKAAAELGIKKVVHTGPQLVRSYYDQDFEITDVPRAPGTGYYGVTKMLSYEICRTYARIYDIQTICFVFNGLGPEPDAPIKGEDFPPFRIFWKDLAHACCLALDIESVPDNYQEFNMVSMTAHQKYTMKKAQRILGYEPAERWENYYKREV